MKPMPLLVLLLMASLLAAPVWAAEEPAKAPEAASAPAATAAAPPTAPPAAPAPAKKTFEKSQLVGAWSGHKLPDLFSTDETIDEFGADFLDGGDLIATYITDRDGVFLKLQMLAKWRVEGDQLIEKGVSVKDIELVSDKKMTKKQNEELVAEQKKKIEQDPEFSKESKDTILFIEGGFMVTKDDKGELMIFKKKQ